MPRSSASLLREFASNPRVVYNRGYDPTQGGGGTGGASRPRAYGRGYAGNQSEDINLQLARMMQAQSGDPDERKRLGQIIAAQDPEVRKKQQEASEYSYRKLVDAATDPRNPMSTGEFNAAYKDWQVKNAGSNLPMPEISQYYKKKVEEKDSTAAIVNTANQIGQTYGVDLGAIQSIIQIDPKTGEVDGESVERAYQRAEKIRNPMMDTQSRSQAKDALNAVEAQMELMKQDTALFSSPDDVSPLDRPTNSAWFPGGPSEADMTAYDTKRTAYDEMAAKRNEILKQLAGSVSQTATQAPPQAPPQAQPQAQPELGSHVRFIEMNYTSDKPFLVDSEDPAEQKAAVKRFIAAAKESGKDQYIQHPTLKNASGSPKVIKIPGSK